MAKKVSNPKEEIKNAVTNEKAKRAAKESLKTDLHAEQKKAERQRVASSAQAALNSDFISESAKQTLIDIQSEIAYKKQEIQDLCGIETEGTAIADLISAHNVLQAELEEQHAADVKEITEEREKLVAEKNAEILALRETYVQTKKELDAEQKQYEKDLKQAREREAEEYKYNLEREHSKENDAWEDTKNSRERALADREKASMEREDRVSAREEKMSELEEKVASIPSLVAEAEAAGKAAGKAEADKANAFEKRYMTKEHENETNLLNSQVEALKKQVETLTEEKNALQVKLDGAYTRNQELAISVSKNSGITKVIESQPTSSK